MLQRPALKLAHAQNEQLARAHQYKDGDCRPLCKVRSPAKGDGQQQHVEQVAHDQVQQRARVAELWQQPCALA